MVLSPLLDSIDAILVQPAILRETRKTFSRTCFGGGRTAGSLRYSGKVGSLNTGRQARGWYREMRHQSPLRRSARISLVFLHHRPFRMVDFSDFADFASDRTFSAPMPIRAPEWYADPHIVGSIPARHEHAGCRQSDRPDPPHDGGHPRREFSAP